MSKDQSSTPEAEQITTLPTTTDRQCYLAKSIRLDHIPLCMSWSICVLKGNKGNTGPNFTPSFKSIWIYLLAYYHMQYLVLPTPAPNLGQRRTGRVVRALNVVGWRTALIWRCSSKKQGAICLCMDTLNGMCVYTVCELVRGFFVVDFLKAIYIPEK